MIEERLNVEDFRNTTRNIYRAVVVAARGSRTEIRMVNGVGLQRSGYSNEDIAELKNAYMKLFSRRARMEGTAIRDRVQDILAADSLNPHVKYLCEFLMRSFDHGRHGRYLESLRNDPVHRATWKPDGEYKLTISVVGRGRVEKVRTVNSTATRGIFTLTAAPSLSFGERTAPMKAPAASRLAGSVRSRWVSVSTIRPRRRAGAPRASAAAFSGPGRATPPW